MTPVITIRELQKEAAEGTKTRAVTVRILGDKLKITTNPHRFQRIQTEAVTERLKPATLHIGVYDGAAPVTNVETITFDSASSDMNERVRWVSLSLKSMPYAKKKLYLLVLRNAEANSERQRAEVTIDLAFDKDL